MNGKMRISVSKRMKEIEKATKRKSEKAKRLEDREKCKMTKFPGNMTCSKRENFCLIILILSANR